MGVIKYIIVGYVTTFILGLIETRKKITTGSLYHFKVRPPKGMFVIGAIATALFSFIIYMTYLQEGISPGTVFIYIICIIVLIIPSLWFMLSPVKGFEHVIVDDDDIYSVNFWIIRKHTTFQEISHCTVNKGDIKVFVKGKKHRLFMLNTWADNSMNFIKRIEKEGISNNWTDPEITAEMAEKARIRRANKKPSKEERRAGIAEMMKENPQVTKAEMAEKYKVTEGTVSKDLREMKDAGLIE